MKGLLHRVAARAAGSALLLRADVGRQFAAGGGGATWDGADAAGWQTGPASADVRAGPWSAASPPARAALSAAAPPMPMAPIAGPAGQADRRGPQLNRPPDATLLAAARLSPAPGDAFDPPPSPPRALQPPVPAVEGPAPSQAAAFDAPPPSTLARAVPLSEPPALQAFATATAAAGPATPRTPLARGPGDRHDPAPLLPAGPRPAPLAPMPPPASQRQAEHAAGAAAAAADSDVHIHIGRIDVTAVQDSPSPRRRAAPAQPPLSLDGYLAQRGRS